MAPVSLVIFLIVSTLASTSIGLQCGRLGRPGTCKTFKECYPYLAIAESTQNTPINEQLLNGIIESSELCGSTARATSSDNVICCPDIDETGPDVTIIREDGQFLGNYLPNKFGGIAGIPIKPISAARPRPPTPAPVKIPSSNLTEEKCFGQYVVVPSGQNSVAIKNSYPFMAALVDKSKGRQFCGGTLIDNRHVLTAAHCFAGFWSTKNLAVYLGSHDLSKDEPVSVDMSASHIFKHGHFNLQTMDYDIAIIRLSKPVTYSKEIHSICLSSGAKRYDDGNSKGTLAGWGRTYQGSQTSTVLRHTTFSILTNQACKARYSGAVVPNSRIPPPPVRETNICAGSNGRDACQGDSGGPLFVKEGGLYEQIGIVSWGIGCGTYPGVYTRVSSYRDWIAKQIQKP